MKITNTRPAGFTLLELLIVIAILALLVSILLPNLSRSKELARKAVCLSNIRHLAVSNHLYAQDNGGCFVLASEDIWRRNLRRWHGRRDTVNEAFDPRRGPLTPYMGSAGLKECPSFCKECDFSDTAGQEAAFEAGCGGYGYNQSYIGGRNDRYGIGEKASVSSARIEDVSVPGSTVMFTDSAYVTMTGSGRTKIAYSFCEPPFWEFGDPGGPSSMMPDPTIDFRHLDQCNVSWADGHATSHNLDFTVSYQTHSLISGQEAAEQGVGWFGPRDNSLFDLK
jgi:prepilin-type N-terminal cleavage/methylation domain-containing protein/prepilin-type processing-associated H-X9-DG protein